MVNPFQEEQKNAILAKELENLDDHGCPKVQDLVDEDWLICSSYRFRHKATVHCAVRNAKFCGNCIMRLLKL